MLTSFLGCESSFEDASVVLFGAPFDGTTTYRPGARFAPRRIREESYGIETYSPYFGRDLSELQVHDRGELDFPFGNTERVLDMVTETAATIFAENKIPFMIGGEHLLSLATVRAGHEKYPDLHVIHFDAHTDLRDDYLGEKLSHSSVMRRIHELVGDRKIFQYGIRSGEKAEFEFGRVHNYLTPHNFAGLERCREIIGGHPVYLSIDLDVLDPSEFPGTGTPEAGGVRFLELIAALKTLQGLNIVGLDLVELCPPYDASGISVACACKLVRELLLLL